MQKPRKILLVDDNQVFIAFVTALLRKLGFSKVIIADNGIEALKLMKLWRPDTVIMDIIMPGMDGLSTLKHIREDGKTADIPVIMVSGESDEDKAEECRRLGCDGYLTKPLDIALFSRLLQECVAKTGVNMRRHIRTPFNKKVTLIHRGKAEAHYAVSLSEGGIYLRRKKPLPVKTRVEVIIPMEGGKAFRSKGTVIYRQESSGDMFSTPTGMAIEFTGVSKKNRELLSDFIMGIISSGQMPPGE